VQTSYLANTTYDFAIVITLQPGNLCSFVANVQVHPALQTPYFTGVDISDVLTVNVNMATLD